MAINKVVLNEETLIDLSNDTVSEAQVLKGVTFHRPDGEIATGELEPSSGGGGGGTGEYVPLYKVSVVDYDGTVLKEEFRAEGDIFELPEQPTHEGKVFMNWLCPLTITDECVIVPDIDLTIRPLYATEDGTTKFFIELQEWSPKTLTLSFSMRIQSSVEIVTVNWGDGTTDTLEADTYASTTKAVSHTYAPVSYPARYTVSMSSNHSLMISGGTLNRGTTNWRNSVLIGVHVNNATFTNSEQLAYCANLRYAILYNCGFGSFSGTLAYNKSLKDVTVSNVNITYNTFNGCDSLENFVFTKYSAYTNYMFQDCTALKSAILPSGVTSLAQGTFSGCSRLERVRLPETLKTIGNETFKNCLRLKSVNLPEGLTSMGDTTFYGCEDLVEVTVPSLITTFGASTFYACKSLKRVQFLGALTSIPSSTFYNCQALEYVAIPETVTSIGSLAFENCYELREAPLHEGITTIGSYAFAYCESLTNVRIPDSVTSIGDYTFASCKALLNVVLPSEFTSIVPYMFQDCGALESVPMTDKITTIGNYAFKNCTMLKNVVIPDNVTTVGLYAFQASGVQNVTIGSGLTAINSSVFRDCSALTNIEFPDNITSIGTYAFSYCTKLKSVKMPSGLTSIAANAFANTSVLKLVDFRTATAVPTLAATNAFKKNTGMQFVVPDELYDTWIAATNWTSFASYIFKASEVTIE